MRAVCLFLAMGCASWLAAAAAPIPKTLRKDVPDDRAKLVGTWEMVTISTESGTVGIDGGLELRVPDEHGKAVYAIGGLPETTCVITMIPNDSPKSLDWTFDDSGGPVAYQCVYELSDSKLVIVRRLTNTDDRPNSCVAGQKGCVLYEFERKK